MGDLGERPRGTPDAGRRVIEGESLEDRQQDGPLVSVITPSYNQGDYIEATIQSVEAQDYPLIEHIVVDGGSTDGTLGVLERYPTVRWISEPDEGQSDAINKGLRMARGDVIGWLNSDDLYLPGAVAKAVAALGADPQAAMVYSNYADVEANGRERYRFKVSEFDLDRLINSGQVIPQPSVFIRKDVLQQVGGVDTRYRYAMDVDLWIRIGKIAPIRHVDDYWAAFRIHEASKTNAERDSFWPEVREISRRHGGRFFSRLFIRHWSETIFGTRLLLALKLLRYGDYRTLRRKVWSKLRGREDPRMALADVVRREDFRA